MPATDVQPQSRNGHGRLAPEADRAVVAPGEPVPKTIQIRPEAKDLFEQAAQRAGLRLIDAADLAARLLDRATRGEQPETAAQRVERLAAKFGDPS